MSDKIRSILAAIDFSESSLNALDTAAALAVMCKASLTIVHVNERISGIDRVLSEPSRGLHSADILNAHANDIYQKHKIHARLILEEGSPSHGISRQAITGNADLVIMGTYGASGYREGFIGTTLYNTIKLAGRPILSIPAGRKWVPFKKILMPVRPAVAQREQLGIIRQLSSSTATIEILSLYPGERVTVKQPDAVMAGLEEHPGGLHTIPLISKEAQLPENVLAHAELHNSDVIVLLSSIDANSRQHFIGPYSQRILHHARVPVLFLGNKM